MGPLVLFVCGDVMTGRGIDQVLAHPSRPQLFEPWVSSALEYVELAERRSGAIPRGTASDYVWGDALAELTRRQPDVRIVNLETAVTTSDAPWPGKGIHYRMHPRNVGCLTAARIDCCVLANNHVMDWGRAGLVETLTTLHRVGIATAGAGRDAHASEAPATFDLGNRGRVLVFAFATLGSGVPAEWTAANRAGMNVLRDLSAAEVRRIAAVTGRHRRAGDVVVLSLHWGGNWGYEIPADERRFAHGLIEAAGVDVVHGHSSHHVKAIEVHRDRLILYGCGDFLTDYEGIGGHEAYRGDLGLMYFPTLETGAGRLVGLTMAPVRVHRFRVERASLRDSAWLRATLDREGAAFGTGVEVGADGTIELRWHARH